MECNETNYCNMKCKNANYNHMKCKHKYIRENEANGLGPNPQAQLPKTNSVKKKLNAHFIS